MMRTISRRVAGSANLAYASGFPFPPAQDHGVICREGAVFGDVVNPRPVGREPAVAAYVTGVRAISRAHLSVSRFRFRPPATCVFSPMTIRPWVSRNQFPLRKYPEEHRHPGHSP